MATIIRDKIKQPDGKDFKLLDAIDIEYNHTKEDGTTTTSVKERLDGLNNEKSDIAHNHNDLYYKKEEVDTTINDAIAAIPEVEAIPDSEIIALFSA